MNSNRKKWFYYKGMRVNSFGFPINTEKSERKGNKRMRYARYHASFNSSFTKKQLKNLLVMYDIPHKMKRERDWFRRHLIKFGFSMIQKSVWIGPSPLPKDFLEYVDSIGLKDKLQKFKLAKTFTKFHS